MYLSWFNMLFTHVYYLASGQLCGERASLISHISQPATQRTQNYVISEAVKTLKNSYFLAVTYPVDTSLIQVQGKKDYGTRKHHYFDEHHLHGKKV